MRYVVLFLMLVLVSGFAIRPKVPRNWKEIEGDEVPFGRYNHPFSVGRLYQTLYLLDKVFKEEGITYWMTDGTLLGALRHGGFIPWDRDADLHIFKRDVDKLLGLKEKLQPYGIEMFPSRDSGCMTAYFALHSRSKVKYRIPLGNRKSAYNIAVIQIVPIHYIEEMDYYLPMTKIVRKIWPKGYIWYEDEISSFKPYQFGPIQLMGPVKAEPYILRHYGKRALKRIEGGVYNMTYPKDGQEYPMAHYDFASDELPIPPESKKDSYFLNGKLVSGYPKLRVEKRYRD